MILKTDLLQHQVDAINKLSKLKVGALYMEQGTGKTRTALELIANRFEQHKVSHVLWLCPCSVKTNLKKEIQKHIGSLPSEFTICGIETLSSSIKTNASLLQLVNSKNCYFVVDESNLVKNHCAKRTRNIINLSKHCTYKLILNGTPVTRNESDLFSQWYILDWRILGYKSFYSFAANHLEYDEDHHGKVVRCLNIDYLTRKIAPYTYQVRKSECIHLPDKTYDTIYYSMSDRQWRHYYDVSCELIDQIEDLKDFQVYKLFTAMQDIISGLHIDSYKTITTSKLFENPRNNPRIQCLLDTIYDISEKIIIFCKFTHEIDSVLSILQEEYGKGSAVRFDGTISLKERNKNLEQFETTARFLIANKTCAGYGLNLQYCSYVIYYSNDWDLGTRLQSEDRIHRIGQHNNVNIIDICAIDTLDERIIRCLHRKEGLLEELKDNIKNKQDLKQYLFGGKQHAKNI